MRAAVYERTGPARDVLEIRELPDPVPAAGEVRVRIAFSGVNPSDVKSRRGAVNPKLPYPRVVPHSDGAGVIDAVGDGVDQARVGQRVWIWNGAWGRADGTAAELIVVPAAQAVPLPENIGFDAGACLGIPALTALHAVEVDGGVRDKRVLVAGGAGAVGHYAIQFARAAGAREIVATVSSAQKEQLARVAGADVVINYKAGDVADAIKDGVDRVIEVDFGANVALDIRIVRPEGHIVVYGSGVREIPVPFGPSIMKNIRYSFFIVYNLSSDDRRRAIARLTELLEQNSLQHNIAARLPLSDVARAHEMVESGEAIGNVVLQI